jgi:hypothetical protein
MPRYSLRSQDKLSTCHPDLQKVFNEVIKRYDCTIVYGKRGKEAQNEAYANGFSKVKYPNSKHNTTPSRAVDVLPYHTNEPHLRWNDDKSAYHFAGYVLRVAEEMGIKIRFGIDWDGDLEFKDQGFIDRPHYELVGTKYDYECKVDEDE